MGYATFRRPDGRLHEFKIAGDTPTPTEEARIQAILSGNPPPSKAPEKAEAEPGIFTSFGSGVKRGIDNTQAGLASLGEYAAREGLIDGDPEEWRKSAEEQRQQASEHYAPEGGFFEQDGFYNKTRFLAGVAGESLPGLIGGVGGTLAGGVIGGPVGATVGAIAGSGAYVPQIFNENLERQIEQHGEVKDWDKALGTSVAGAAVEGLTDRVTLGVAGLIKKPLSKVGKKAVEKGVKKATTIAARRVGGATAVGAMTGASEEAIQTALSRWQAEMPVGDEEAQAEYIEAAVVGAILEGVFGTASGTIGARSEIKTQKQEQAAVQAAEAEQQRMAQAVASMPDRTPKKAETPKPFLEDFDSINFAGQITDRSQTKTREELALENADIPPLPEQEDTRAKPKPTAFSEDEYLKAIELLRDEKSVAPDKIKNRMKIGRPKAQAIFKEMLARNDARPTGSKGQYLTVTVPKGLKTRKNANVTGKIDENAQTREYVVAPVDSTARKPYTVTTSKGRKVGDSFRTREEAQAWANKAGIPSFQISEDTSGRQYGLYEVQYRKDKSGEDVIAGKRVVNTFSSIEEANKAAQKMRPDLSPETNVIQEEAIDPVKKWRDDLQRELRPYQKSLQKIADSIVGKDRAKVELPTQIDDLYLRMSGVAEGHLPGGNAVVEGVALPKTEDTLREVVAVSNDLVDTNLSPSERLRRLKGVLTHELVHTMRNADLLTPSEWKALAKYAQKTKVPGERYTWLQRQQARQQAGSPYLMEETIAEMLRAHAENPHYLDKPVRGVIGKLLDFLKRLMSFSVNKTGDQVIQSILGGEMASRKTGHGGMGDRGYPGDPLFSKVKVDPFYSQAEDFFYNAKQEKGTASQWLGMLKNSGVKKEELEWLDLEEWFRAFNNEPITKGQILDYIRASSMEVKETWAFTDSNATIEEEEAFEEVDAQLGKMWEEISTALRDSPNYEYYLAKSAEEGRPLMEVIINEEADIDPHIRQLADLKNRYEQLAAKVMPPQPRWGDYTQEGGENYTTVAFHLPVNDRMQPTYPGNHHYDIDNVIAFARMKERMFGRKRVLFIEEIQSDLHQKAAGVGGYNTRENRERVAQLQQRLKEVESEIDQLEEENSQYLSTGVNMSHLVEERLDRLSSERYTLQYQLDHRNDRSEIPDAPLKSTWEEFTLKRLIRYAAENDFDAIAWHGEPDSVADTEKYNEFTKVTEERGTESWAHRIGLIGGRAENLSRAIEKAIDAGDTENAATLERMFEIVTEPRDTYDMLDEVQPSKELMDKYFPVDPGGQRFYSDRAGSINLTAIVNRYLQKLPRIAKKLGKKFGAVPVLENPRLEEDADINMDFTEYFMSPDDVYSFILNMDPDPEIVPRLEKAAQIMQNQRIVDVNEAMHEAGVRPQDVERAFGENATAPAFDMDGNPAYRRWTMDLTEEMRDTALYKGFPMFASVDMDTKSFEGFEQGKDIRSTKLNIGDRLDVQFPKYPFVPMYSAVDKDRKFENIVRREMVKHGYNPFTRQRLAKARIYDRGQTPYGMPLETGEPEYAKEYIVRQTDKGPTPLMGVIENPNNGKREPAVIHMGADWKSADRGVSWPIGYGFNHAQWHFQQIAKDTGVNPTRPDMLRLFVTTMARGGELKMDRGNMGIISYKAPNWRKPLKIVLQRQVIGQGDPFFPAKQPVWKLITAYTEEGPAPTYSIVNLDPLPQYSMNAPMGQRVPPQAPQNIMDQIEARTTYNNLAPAIEKLTGKLPGTWKYKAKSGVESFIINAQDKMMPVGDLIDRLRKNGGVITNETDTYFRETMFSGQTDERLHDARRKLYDPIIAAINSLPMEKKYVAEARSLNAPAREIMDNYNDSRTAVAELYLYAQHAQERNAEMRRRNEKVKDKRPDQYVAGSGMTDEEAATILEWVESLPFADRLSSLKNPKSIRSLFRDIIANTNDTRVDGLLNPDFRTMVDDEGNPLPTYDDYAPLRGFIDEHMEADEEAREFAKAGKGFRIMNKEDRSAIGRRTLGTDLIAHAILQNEEAIVRSNKNRVARSFVNLVRQNPEMMKDVAEIVSSHRRKFVYDAKTGRVREVPDPSVRTDPNVLVAKEGGKEVFVKIHDPRIARAMVRRSGLGDGVAAKMMGMLLSFNRFLANTRTAWNPEFLINNFFRDMQTALVNLTENEVEGLRRRVTASIPNAMRGVWEGERSDTANTEWGKIYKQFKERGGKTAFYGIRELEDTINKINSELQYKDEKNLLHASKEKVKAVANYIEAMNVTVENAIRVSAYKALRDLYLEKSGNPSDPRNIKRAEELAARAGKNVTVNFNMGGELKPFMNSLYLFYNAGIQGSMALINPLIRSPKVRKMWASFLVAGIMQDIIMSLVADHDEDGISQYDKIDEYVLESNMVFMDPFGLSERGYFKIPLPYVLNGVFNAGRAMSALARGKMSVGEAFNSAAGVMADSLNPLGAYNSFLNFVAPTLIDPAVDLVRNENFAGAPIAPAQSPFGTSEIASQRYWNNTSPAYVTVAEWLSRITGSKGEYIPGSLEFSPNQVEYMFEWIGGGAFTFGRRIWDFASPVGSQGVFYEALSGGDWSSNDVPILRRFYGNITTRNDLEYYIKNRDRIMQVRAELKEAVKQGDSQRYVDVVTSFPTEYRLASRINSIENARRKISRQINKIRESRRLTEEQKREMIRMLKAKQDELVGAANSLFRGTE